MTLTMVKEDSVGDTITVRDGLVPASFRGHLVAMRDWSGDISRRPGRWTEMYLYKVEDRHSPYNYALQIIQRSVVFHMPDGCSRGRKTSVEEAYKNPEWYASLRPCYDCSSNVDLDDLPDDANIFVEKDRFELHRCVTVEHVIDGLRDKKKNNTLSSLGMELLQDAADADTTIATFLKATRSL